MAVGKKLQRQLDRALHGQVKRGHIGNLRADVQAYARHTQVFVSGGAAAEFAGAADGYTEFVFAQAGGDVRVRLGGDIRIHSQGNVRDLSQLSGACGQQLKLAFTLHVKKQNAAAQGQL